MARFKLLVDIEENNRNIFSYGAYADDFFSQIDVIDKKGKQTKEDALKVILYQIEKKIREDLQISEE